MRCYIADFRSSLFTVPILIVLLLISCTNAQREEEYEYDIPSAQHNDVDPASGPVYRPTPVQPAPPPQDASVLNVPRLGRVRGLVGYKTIRHRAINAFLGIKYGVVRDGLYRFQKAFVPDNLSNRIIDATREAANCPQFPELKQVREAEQRGINTVDCLTLNIYAPNKTGQFPVLVYVHGEMLFDGGAAEAQPDYLLEHDVVLVSLNYRLAPFGFLTSLTEIMPGNVALADIQMALEWIQQYIRPFGGDANQVLLFGQAGGATLVHALSLSDKAQGLFHKLILQSGTALNPYFIDEDPISTLRTFARLARCSDRTPQVLSFCLGRLSTSELLDIFQRHWEENEPLGLPYVGGFKLAIGDLLGYLPTHPAALVANHTYPVIAGVVKDAGAFVLSRFYNQLEQLRSRNISDYINVVLKHTTQPRYHALWRQWALRHIFTEEDIRNPTVYQLVQGLLEMINLILYRAPIIDSIRYTYRQNPTYLYCFDYRGQFHRFGHLRSPLPFALDAELSDENIYIFPYPSEVSRLNPEDITIARALTTMWYNFAQYNVPNYNPGIWPSVSSEYGPFVRVTNSKEKALELDYHFGEGIAVPNLYLDFFTSSTTTTSTTRRPYYNNYYANNYRGHETVLQPY